MAGCSNSIPRRGHRPVAQHGVDSIVPLKLKALGQLVGFFWRRLAPTPHLRPHGLYGSICSHKVAGGSRSALLLYHEPQ